MFAGFASILKCTKSPETEVKPTQATPPQAEVKPPQAEVKPPQAEVKPPQAKPPRGEFTPAVGRVISRLFSVNYPTIDLYWYIMALRGDSLPREFTVPGGYVDELRARQLSAALTRAGYLGFVCEGGTCKRAAVGGDLPPVRFNYSELIAQNTHEHVVDMIETAQKGGAWVNIVDNDGVCHVSVAMEMVHEAQNAHRNPYAEHGRVNFGRNGSGETRAEIRARLEGYCRERNFDIV